MTTAWDWVAPIRQTHFGSPLVGKYPIEPLADANAYWALHEELLRRHFPPECSFNLPALLSDHQRRSQERIAASEGADRLADFWVARDQDNIVAMFCGTQRAPDTYRMWHSHVHPDYRRRGVYADIVQRMIDYTRDLGFSTVVSDHAPSNNAILIAKLKAGFRIVSLEIDPMVGASIILKYFHNPAHLRAYEFRCGLATLDDELIAHGRGGMPLLIEQIRRAGTTEPQ